MPKAALSESPVLVTVLAPSLACPGTAWPLCPEDSGGGPGDMLTGVVGPWRSKKDRDWEKSKIKLCIGQ